MNTARQARILMKKCNSGTLTLLTKYQNEFFPISQTIPFALTTEGEVLIFLDDMEIRNRGIKKYNRSGLYISKNNEAVEIMGRLVELSTSDLRSERLKKTYFSIHKDMSKYAEVPNYKFYILKNDFCRYYSDPQNFQSLAFEGFKVNPPLSVIELSNITKEFSDYAVEMVDGDGFFLQNNNEVKFQPFLNDMNSVDEVYHEMAMYFRSHTHHVN